MGELCAREEESAREDRSEKIKGKVTSVRHSPQNLEQNRQRKRRKESKSVQSIRSEAERDK